jgi:hypothetical protein
MRRVVEEAGFSAGGALVGGVHYNKHSRRRQKVGLLGLQPGEEGQGAAARYSLLGTKAQAAWKPDYRH